MDRIDIHLEVPALNYKQLTSKAEGEGSREVCKRINHARGVQRKRYGKAKILKDGKANTFWNAHLGPKDVEKFCQVAEDGKELLRMAIVELGLSARAYDKVLKLGRTIADLAGSDLIKAEHISEAISYRSLDRNLWTF